MSTDLLAAVIELRARVAELERIQIAGAADRHLTLAETAARIGPGKSARTLRLWLADVQRRRRLQLDTLLVRDPSGRWYSTVRRVENWQRDMAKKFIPRETR